MLEARNLSGHLEIDPDGNEGEQGDEDDALAAFVYSMVLLPFSWKIMLWSPFQCTQSVIVILNR